MKKMMFLMVAVFTIILMLTACTEKGNGNYTEGKTFQPVALFPEPPRPAGQKDVLELRCDPIDTVRIAFIGLGNRGSGAVQRYTKIKGVKIKAICDLEQWKVDRAQKTLTDNGLPKAERSLE